LCGTLMAKIFVIFSIPSDLWAVYLYSRVFCHLRPFSYTFHPLVEVLHQPPVHLRLCSRTPAISLLCIDTGTSIPKKGIRTPPASSLQLPVCCSPRSSPRVIRTNKPSLLQLQMSSGTDTRPPQDSTPSEPHSSGNYGANPSVLHVSPPRSLDLRPSISQPDTSERSHPEHVPLTTDHWIPKLPASMLALPAPSSSLSIALIVLTTLHLTRVYSKIHGKRGG
jgi:hypothetical protein